MCDTQITQPNQVPGAHTGAFKIGYSEPAYVCASITTFVCVLGAKIGFMLLEVCWGVCDLDIDQL